MLVSLQWTGDLQMPSHVERLGSLIATRYRGEASIYKGDYRL
jgi:hypothetical protein